MYEKYIQKMMAICLVLSLVTGFPFPINHKVVAAVEYSEGDKVYCSATLENEFTDNEALIVVTPENNTMEYTISDFSDVGGVALKELSIDPSPNTLGRIFELTLDTNSKQNVLDAVYQLELRADIYTADIFCCYYDAEDIETEFTITLG